MKDAGHLAECISLKFCQPTFSINCMLKESHANLIFGIQLTIMLVCILGKNCWNKYYIFSDKYPPRLIFTISWYKKFALILICVNKVALIRRGYLFEVWYLLKYIWYLSFDKMVVSILFFNTTAILK